MVNGRKFSWTTTTGCATRRTREVKAYLESGERAHLMRRPTEPLQKQLADEMLGRIKETDVEVPYKKGDYFYYTRTEAGKKSTRIRCRKKSAQYGRPEEVLLDVNRTGEGADFHGAGRIRSERRPEI